LLDGKFDFDDFLKQIQQVKKMGSLTKMLNLIPGMGQLAKEIPEDVADKQLAQTEAIISSMTLKERKQPKLLNASRKRRIAAGSGTSVQDINQLVSQFRDMQKMVKQLRDPAKRRNFMNMFGG